jgi:hypothetical protein
VNVPKRRWASVEDLFAKPFNETLDVVLATVPLPSLQAKIDQINALKAEVKKGAVASITREIASETKSK